MQADVGAHMRFSTRYLRASPPNDTAVQRRAGEGAKRPTRPADCNGGLDRAHEFMKARIKHSGNVTARLTLSGRLSGLRLAFPEHAEVDHPIRPHGDVASIFTAPEFDCSLAAG